MFRGNVAKNHKESAGVMRINKALSFCGLMSRRAVDEAILKGRVKVNGRLAQLGMNVDLKKDKLELDNRPIKAPIGSKKVYLMLNKPRGYVCSAKDELGRRVATDLLVGVAQRVYSIGRLDKDSEGLLLFTNDGEFANQIMHPNSGILKSYRATVYPPVSEEQLIKLNSEFLLDGEKLAPVEVFVEKEYDDRTVLSFGLMQGKNRQIRRMCQAVGLTVKRLRRVSIGPQKLGMLAPGKFRYLTEVEVARLRGGKR